LENIVINDIIIFHVIVYGMGPFWWAWSDGA